MEYQEILNGNKLIAEFMGHKIWVVKHYEGDAQSDRFEISIKDYDKFVDKGFKYDTYARPFHSDWNLLMSVIDKIEDVTTIGQRVYFGIDPFKITAYCSGVLEKQLSVFSYEDSGTHFNGGSKKIDALWKAVVKTLNWYFNERGK